MIKKTAELFSKRDLSLFMIFTSLFFCFSSRELNHGEYDVIFQIAIHQQNNNDANQSHF